MQRRYNTTCSRLSSWYCVHELISSDLKKMGTKLKWRNISSVFLIPKKTLYYFLYNKQCKTMCSFVSFCLQKKNDTIWKRFNMVKRKYRTIRVHHLLKKIINTFLNFLKKKLWNGIIQLSDLGILKMIDSAAEIELQSRFLRQWRSHGGRDGSKATEKLVL